MLASAHTQTGHRYPRPHIAVLGSEERVPAGLPCRGWLVLTSVEVTEMRKPMTDRMDDYDVVVMGVLEPILVLSVMAVIAFRLQRFAM